jgi:hypothetical protein
MAKKSIASAKIIEEMINLSIQREDLDQQIKDLKPAFLEACAQQDIEQVKYERALVYRKITPGRWTYPDNIVQHQEQLKQLKQDFQDTHEPTDGREISWVIKIYAG